MLFLVHMFLEGMGIPALSPIGNQRFAQYSHDLLYDIDILVAFFVAAPIVLATAPGIQSILDDKDNHVTALLLLMGCTETEHWLVQVVVLFIASVIPYTLISVMMCYMFAMVGTSFTLFLVVSILFCISHIFFMLMTTSLMKTALSGRILTVAFGIMTIFFGYLHFFYTLNENNTSTTLKHLLSIFPISAYQLLALTMFMRVKNGSGGVGWSDITAPFVYPIWYGIMWLCLDSIIFLLLWMLLNATSSKSFGLQLIRWRDIFKKSAWDLVFGGEQCAEEVGQDEVLSVEGLTKTYKGRKTVRALDDVNFTIKRGEVIVMIGPNGAGKSTIINTVAGAITKDSGMMRLLGGSATERFQSIHKHLGICFQENVLIDLLNVQEHFELFGAFKGLEDGEVSDAIDFLGTTLQLGHVMQTRAKDLSGGQKRKLCLALALLGDPPLVIMDEPTAGVDIQARQLIWKTIASLRNAMCLITSHALEEAEAVSSRLFIVSQGKIPFMGTSTELRREFKCGYILRVELREGAQIDRVLSLVQQHVPDSKFSDDRPDSIFIQISRNVPAMLQQLSDCQEQLGITSYSFAVEQLEDTLMRMIESAEAAFDGSTR